MALPAPQPDWEKPSVEERIARLESDVKHIQSDVSEIKVDIREMRQDVRRLDAKIDDVNRNLGEKIEAGDLRLSGKTDALKDSVAALALAMERSFAKMERSISAAKIWAFGLYIALAAGLLLVLARGFKWI